MKNKIQIFVATVFVCGFMAVVNTVKAQTTSNNTIQEVQLNKNDAFSEIRNLLMSNFDFTNSDYKQGVVNSQVQFEVAENGKIVNVHSKGDCKNVSKEIEKVLSSLQYKIDSKKLNENMIASTYVMPVKVDINNR
ncbi:MULTISPECIES: hypothetical protein [Chryseobacterium]|uniref:TonB C-terminal domain-containing protein n=1 Tax=Chryseobacterium glaciei TaxID=1685010 RepID=A0A172Y006_9FLAO|nr:MULTISPECIES: hypothetical protein [Chryseobacterium]ANF52442.1 hypothetical protein A0O34_18800 [Chryseobacterium glaciei]AZA55017.1 hypothetical protein EG348_19445 [Chryseobacterium sp. G0201]